MNVAFVLRTSQLPSPVTPVQNDRAPDLDLVLSASELALLGQRRGQRSTLRYLRLP
jgi:hypothetical protein